MVYLLYVSLTVLGVPCIGYFCGRRGVPADIAMGLSAAAVLVLMLVFLGLFGARPSEWP